MFYRIFVSTVVVSLTTVTAVLAQDAEDAPERRGPSAMFDRLDADGDGTISVEEFGGVRLGMLREADADADGALTRDELQTYVMNRAFMRRAEAAARLLDIDGDGTVTLVEIEDHRGKRFALLDGNNDGTLSRDELQRGAMMLMRGRGGDGPRFAMRGEEHGPRHKLMRRMHGMERDMPAMPMEESPGEE